MIPGFVEFEFDLPGALLQELILAFEQVTPAPLLSSGIEQVPEEQGVYQLLLKNRPEEQLVYIGKTDSESGLRDRLQRHGKKVQHRLYLDPENVLFKAVRVFVFTAVDLEAQLIKHYERTAKVSWNGSGFGSNDPGRERDTTTYKPDHFDAMFPIDIDRELTFPLPSPATAAKILQTLKVRLPYLIRFETDRKLSRRAHSDLEKTEITVDRSKPITPKNVIAQIISKLPPGWHATMLPSHVIIYKNDPRKFPSGQLIADS